LRKELPNTVGVGADIPLEDVSAGCPSKIVFESRLFATRPVKRKSRDAFPIRLQSTHQDVIGVERTREMPDN
jgi:hypothetical protein